MRRSAPVLADSASLSSGSRAKFDPSRRAPFPESLPREINHAVLTGTLSADPQEARSPGGERVTLLRIEFPVADPDHPRALWTWASCLVEVSGGRARLDLEGLHGGAPVLAAGQLSDRWMIEGGETIPGLDVLIRLAGAYVTSVGDFVDGVTRRPGWIERSGPAEYLVSDDDPQSRIKVR